MSEPSNYQWRVMWMCLFAAWVGRDGKTAKATRVIDSDYGIFSLAQQTHSLCASMQTYTRG